MNNETPRVDPSFWRGLLIGTIASVIIWGLVIITWSNT